VETRIAVPFISISARDSAGIVQVEGTWALHGWDSFATADGSGKVADDSGARTGDALEWNMRLLARYPETYRALMQSMRRAGTFDGYAEIRGTFDGLRVSGAVSTYYREG